MKNSTLRSKLKFFWNELVKIKNKLISSSISKLRFATVFDMLVKTILFLVLLHFDESSQMEAFYRSVHFSFVYLGFILFVYSFGYLFSKNKQTIYYIFFNIIYSIILIADLWYFRVNGDFFAIKNIFFNGTFNPSGLSLFNFKTIDLMFFIDIIIIVSLTLFKKISNTHEKNVKNFIFSLRTSLILILISFLFFDVFHLASFGNSMIYNQWSTSMSVQAPGPLGYHIVEASKSLGKALTKPSDEDKTAILKWLEYNNEKLSDNKYKGIFKEKNVIFLQIESLENFVINQKTNGKEITPFLNKLTREGLYFNNIYEQNNAGNSIDCDFMINSSIYPLGDEITALNYIENIYPNSLPRILNAEGYTTITSHAEEPGEFNWTQLHKNSFGAQKLWSINDYNYDETVGYGLSDKSFLTQLSKKLKDVKQPFFIQAPTLSSHGPFNIDKKYRELNLPTDIDKNYLGGYFESVHYTDNQIKMFFSKLKEYNLLDNSVIVIYGDHAGVHKYYNNDIQSLNYENNWWKNYDHKIPLIIYSPNSTHAIISASGGQTDILPTISYLLGINNTMYSKTSMGRVLVNTNRDATVLKGNTIVGNVKSKEEEQHLLDAYEIGNKIIKSDFFAQS